jgi:prevent-host-death family protein
VIEVSSGSVTFITEPHPIRHIFEHFRGGDTREPPPMQPPAASAVSGIASSRGPTPRHSCHSNLPLRFVEATGALAYLLTLARKFILRLTRQERLTYMSKIISAKTLRNELARIVERVRKGEHFTVLYRSRPAFRILPMDGSGAELGKLAGESLYQAEAVERSTDGLTAADHDRLLYTGSER